MSGLPWNSGKCMSNLRNVPLDQLDPHSLMKSRNSSASEPLYLVCRFGGRGQQACEQFLKAGFSNVLNVEGGTLACIDAGLPVVRGKQAMSLERQVRIAAGSLVLIGVSLGWFLHPAFFGLSAFVGAGLVFAGITDTCGMGMVLARMPWNYQNSVGLQYASGHRLEIESIVTNRPTFQTMSKVAPLPWSETYTDFSPRVRKPTANTPFGKRLSLPEEVLRHMSTAAKKRDSTFSKERSYCE